MSGWSNSQFTGTLTIPDGATTGARIVLDGTTGIITVYNAANFPVITIDGTSGIVVQSGIGSLSTIALDIFGRLFIGSGSWDNRGGIDISASSMSIFTPSDNTGTQDDPITFSMTPGDSDGTPGAQAAIEALANGNNVTFTVGGPIITTNLRSGTAVTPAPGVGGGTSTVSVLFAVPMSGTPRVSLTAASAADPSITTMRAYALNISSTGFDIAGYRSNDSSTTWMYTAQST